MFDDELLRVKLFSQNPGTDDAELFHVKLEGGAIHSQVRGRALWSGENPSGLFQCRQDMCTVGIFQSLVLPINRARCGVALKVSERNL